MNRILSVSVLGMFALVSTAQAGVCPVHIRAAHTNPRHDTPIDVRVNGKSLFGSVAFRSATDYVAVNHGTFNLEVVDTKSGEVLGTKSFPAGSGKAYTIAFTGPVTGPAGSLFGEASPFVFMDDITPPNPGRWKGHWYRLSETNVNIDLMITQGTMGREVGRVVDKPNKASYYLPDLPAGIYTFNPVLIGSTRPLLNQALIPPAYVEVAGITIDSGEVMDLFAAGNALGVAPNSLQLFAKKFRPSVTEDGCLKVESTL